MVIVLGLVGVIDGVDVFVEVGGKEVLVGVFVGEFVKGPAQFYRPLYAVVLDVREVDYVGYPVALLLDMAPYNVKSDGGLGVAHVGVVVGVDAADVHSDLIAVDGHEFFQFAGQRVVNHESHFNHRILSDWP